MLKDEYYISNKGGSAAIHFTYYNMNILLLKASWHPLS